MPDYSDLVPANLRRSVSDGTRLKASITTDQYTGGTPSAANQVKPSIMYPDGTLKESIATAAGLKPSWLLAGGVAAPSTDFITTWSATSGQKLTIPHTGTGYSFDIDWGDGETQTGLTEADAPFTKPTAYASTGTVTITISPAAGAGESFFPRIYFSNGGDRLKILTVENWGTNKWTALTNAFLGCNNLDITATDAPNLTSTNIPMTNGFKDCDLSTADISGWAMGEITSLSAAFSGTNFNSQIGDGNTVKCTNFNTMLYNCDAFDQDMSGLQITAATGMTNFALFADGWSTANYSATINGFKAQVAANSDTPAGLSFHGGTSTYDSTAEASHDYLTNPAGPNWTIADGGLV